MPNLGSLDKLVPGEKVLSKSRWGWAQRITKQKVKIPAGFYLLEDGHLNLRCLTGIVCLIVRGRSLLTDAFVRAETLDSSIHRRIWVKNCVMWIKNCGETSRQAKAFGGEKKIPGKYPILSEKICSYNDNLPTEISFSEIPGLDQLKEKLFSKRPLVWAELMCLSSVAAF